MNQRFLVVVCVKQLEVFSNAHHASMDYFYLLMIHFQQITLQNILSVFLIADLHIALISMIQFQVNAIFVDNIAHPVT